MSKTTPKTAETPKTAKPVTPETTADVGIRAPKKLPGCRIVSLKEARALR